MTKASHAPAAPAELDVFACQLGGPALIEASAGTGKTWNICALYLRFLLERGLEVRQILVVTFTNAATAELRDRVRRRIADTLEFLAARARGEDVTDPFSEALIAATARVAQLDLDAVRKRLTLALEYFDEAAIFTIHGFCQRALADQAFSAGVPFVLELVTNDLDLQLETVHDFWRREIAADSCPADLAAWLTQKKDDPEKLAKFLARSLRKPLARHNWGAAGAGAQSNPTLGVQAQLSAPHATAQGLWTQYRDAIIDAVSAASPGLYANSYSEKAIAQAVNEWDAWLRSNSLTDPPGGSEKLALFGATTLQKRTKRGYVPPSHPFFVAAQQLLDVLDAVTTTLAEARLVLIKSLIDWAGPALRQKKRDRRLLAFDDMLFNLYDALTNGQQPALAASLRGRYPAALIDEFQDTDPLQFAIFDRIYGQSDAPVFLVGDPKQAIYSFRNADLHAYLDARSKTTAQYTLGANQRSTQSLIEALNGLFGSKSGAFMLDGLDYHSVDMGKKKRSTFVDRSASGADLQLWRLPIGKDDSVLHKQDAREASVFATATEIARLLTASQSGQIKIGDSALAPGDIAVLVRTHAQGSDLKRALAALDIGSVELAQASVFDSVDAEEVERVLVAINEPRREALLRAALATELLGRDALAIASISAQEEALLSWVEQFADYRDLWLQKGVGVMFRRLLTEQQVTARMLARDDGERRLTNLLHLGEQLHQAATRFPSPDALLRWLAAQRRNGSADEVAQLRLESDRNLVQIVTIHKAKGLEFPVVFCPFLWDGRTRFGGPELEGREYHDPDGTAVIDFRSKEELGKAADDAVTAQVRLEQTAERLRLTYVALTRAVHRCYLIVGTYGTGRWDRPSLKEATHSVLNWLVAGVNQTPDSWLGQKLDAIDIDSAWKAFAKKHKAHVQLADLPTTSGKRVPPASATAKMLVTLPAPASIPAPRWIGSFSSLTGSAYSEAAATDHDAHVESGDAQSRRRSEAPPSVGQDDILRFPSGADAGDCLHAMFERIDFADSTWWDGAIGAAIEAHLVPSRGSRAEAVSRWPHMARRMLADVLGAKLPENIVLSSIPPERRLTELAFHLPAPRVTATKLATLLAAQGYGVPALSFRNLEGYLTGRIDLVFEHDGRYYVLDWKSNRLGWTQSDYGPDAVSTAMEQHGYHLQALLYALALERYVKVRRTDYRREDHFGGVIYLFLRGVRPNWRNPDGTPSGVYFDRPKAATLDGLDGLFGSGIHPGHS